MSRLATPKNEDALLNTALFGTAHHVELQVQLYRKTKRLEVLQQENVRHAQRELSWFTDDDGSLVLNGRFTPEQGALIANALDAAMDQLFQEQKQVPDDVPAGTSWPSKPPTGKMAWISRQEPPSRPEVENKWIIPWR